MPDPEKNEPNPLQALQEQVAQLQRENNFLADEKNTLENLVLSGLPSNRPAPESKPNPGASLPAGEISVDTLVERVVQQVDEKLVKPLKLESDKDKALQELVTLRTDPKTKDVDLYHNEMKSIARQHPSLSMTQVYKLAKEEAGPKKPAPSPESLRTSEIKPAAGAERFSGAEKVKSRAQVDDRRETSFKGAFDDAWEQVMAGKEA